MCVRRAQSGATDCSSRLTGAVLLPHAQTCKTSPEEDLTCTAVNGH